jgi:hypothetical protein
MEAWERRRASLEEAWEAWPAWDWVALEEFLEGQVHRWLACEAWEHHGVSMEPWEHHRGYSWPPWILLYLVQLMLSMKKLKMEITSKMWMSDDLFAFVICKFVLNIIMWI